MYTPGFAAPEQYKNRERLGPWSDIYSVGASMFACMAGFAPQAADARMEDDKMTSATKLWPGEYSEQLLQLIDQCLQLDYMQRPQSVFALQKELVKDVLPEELPPKKTLIGSIRATLNKGLF
jgi:serine/threonine protein kinase